MVQPLACKAVPQVLDGCGLIGLEGRERRHAALYRGPGLEAKEENKTRSQCLAVSRKQVVASVGLCGVQPAACVWGATGGRTQARHALPRGESDKA